MIVYNTKTYRMHLALETVTQGPARATSHRVLSPEPGSTPRYSIPFFQNISQTIKIGENVLQCMLLCFPRGLVQES